MDEDVLLCERRDQGKIKIAFFVVGVFTVVAMGIVFAAMYFVSF